MVFIAREDKIYRCAAFEHLSGMVSPFLENVFGNQLK